MTFVKKIALAGIKAFADSGFRLILVSLSAPDNHLMALKIDILEATKEVCRAVFDGQL